MRDKITVDEIIAKLRRHTFVTRMEFQVDRATWRADLALDLASGEEHRASLISVVFKDVSNLSISNFGGGLTQLLLLDVEDVSTRQLDRVHLQVRELEREMLSLDCRAIEFSDE